MIIRTAQPTNNTSKATAKQCALLQRLGYNAPADQLTIGEASAIIKQLKLATENHRATEKQVTLLRELGYTGDTDALSSEAASVTIDGLINALKDTRERLKASVDMTEFCARDTELHKASRGEYSGPCPRCAGVDRFHCQKDWFHCRQCYPLNNGLLHDVTAYVMWHDNVSEAQAIATLTDGTLALPETPVQRAAPAPKQKDPQTDDWLHSAKLKVDYAHRRLMDDTDTQAEEGRRYLDSRGIEPHTWIAFRLGYTSDASLPGTEGKQKAPAIVISWYRNGKLVAVRYRFLRCHEYTDDKGRVRREKQTALYGSDFTGAIYGGQAVGKRILSRSTLIVCEGELNACSIWQAVHHQNVHVCSLGSESASIPATFVEYAANYMRVIVWMDKEERSQAVAAALVDRNGQAAYPIKSVPKKDVAGQVVTDDKGKSLSQDANDLLRAGQLSGLLAYHRFLAAPDSVAQSMTLWDVWDAAQVWPGTDDYTLSVMARIAKTIGVTLQKEYVTPDLFQFNTNTPAHTERPPLPKELWCSGIVSQAEALQIHSSLSRDYAAELGQNADGHYIDSKSVKVGA